MTDSALPAPPVPATLNLRIFRRMPLDVLRVRDSETAVRTKGDEFRAAVLLWCAAWHQLPAASLPDDDLLLADLAGFGRVVKEWRKVKAGALRGFSKCSDGRLYHKVIAEVAIDSWGAHLKQLWKSECGRTKKAQQRARQTVNLPTFDLWITRNCPEAKPFVSRWTKITSPEDLLDVSPGQDDAVPGKTAPIEGKGSESNSINHSHDGSTTAPTVPDPNPGPRGPRSTPKAGGSWRRDANAAERKLRELGVSTTWSAGKSHDECIQRIELELKNQERASHEHAAQR